MSAHRARLIERTHLSPEIVDLRFQILDSHIACLEPGAHVDIRLAPDLVRQYSLWNWDPEGRWFNIAVKHESGGRGGSIAMHNLSVGDEVEIGGPRNHFALAETAGHITLIAGGIGVTPILAMTRALHASGADFRAFYLVRSHEDAAMDQHFRRMDLGERYRLHCDDTDDRFDLAAVMRAVPAGGRRLCLRPRADAGRGAEGRQRAARGRHPS